MADTQRSYRRDSKTGRFAAQRPVEDVDATSVFNPMGDSMEDIDNVSGAPSPSTIERPRHAPDADDLAQGGQRSPLRARNPALVHPDDEGAHNVVMRTAARRSGLMDPTAYLVGLDSPDTVPTSEGGTSVTLYGDGTGRTMCPRRAQDIDPRRR